MLNIKKLLAHLLQTVPVVLYYDDGVADTADVVFSKNATGYEKIEIFCKDNDGKRGSVSVFKPNIGQSIAVSICSINASNTSAFIKSKTYSFQGTYLERRKQSNGTYGFNGQGAISGSNVSSVASGGVYLTITAVIGYKKLG